MKENEMITINLTKKEITTLVHAFEFLMEDGVVLDEDVEKGIKVIKDQMQEQLQKNADELVVFLDNLYRNHYRNLDRLGRIGIKKLAEVMLIYSDEVIEELKTY